MGWDEGRGGRGGREGQDGWDLVTGDSSIFHTFFPPPSPPHHISPCFLLLPRVPPRFYWLSKSSFLLAACQDWTPPTVGAALEL